MDSKPKTTKTFGRNRNGTRDIDSMHESQKAYQCDICEKYFGRSGDLKRHVALVHNKECSKCSNTFTRKQSMKKHVAYVHEGTNVIIHPNKDNFADEEDNNIEKHNDGMETHEDAEKAFEIVIKENWNQDDSEALDNSDEGLKYSKCDVCGVNDTECLSFTKTDVDLDEMDEELL